MHELIGQCCAKPCHYDYYCCCYIIIVENLMETLSRCNLVSQRKEISINLWSDQINTRRKNESEPWLHPAAWTAVDHEHGPQDGVSRGVCGQEEEGATSMTPDALGGADTFWGLESHRAQPLTT